MTKKPKTPAKEPPRKVSVAVLDADGVLVSVEHGVDEAKARPGSRRIVCAGGCDLEAGHYVWRDGSFWPLVPVGEPERDMNAQTVKVFALGFASLLAQDITLHPDLVAWLDWYSKSIDGARQTDGDDR